MHVGGLSLFVPPEGDDGEFARSLSTVRSPTSTRFGPSSVASRLQFLSNFAPVRWTEDADVDLEYHVRCCVRAAQAGSSPRVARADLHAPRHAARSASAAVGGVRDRRSRRRPSCRVHEDAPRAHGWCVCCSGVVPQPLVGSARSTFDASMGATTFFGAGSCRVAGWTCRGGWAP